MKIAGYLNMIADQLYSYRVLFSQLKNVLFQQNNASCYKAQIVLQWFEENNNELISINVLAFLTREIINQIKHIWNVMEQQLIAQILLCQNIDELCDCCLNI